MARGLSQDGGDAHLLQGSAVLSVQVRETWETWARMKSAPLWEEGMKEGGLYFVFEAGARPGPRCAPCAWVPVTLVQQRLRRALTLDESPDRQRPRRCWSLALSSLCLFFPCFLLHSLCLCFPPPPHSPPPSSLRLPHRPSSRSPSWEGCGCR